MRRDAWNARTWILAVVAGWSLLVAVLAMFGLGGRITPLPADPDLVQPLPRLPAAPAFDLVLSSVLITPRLELAIVQPAQGGEGLRVKLGESPAGFPGWRLTELAPRRAVFDGPEGRRELELRVFDGAGGQPPTVITGTGTVPPAAAPMPGARPTGGNSAPVAVPAGPAPVPAPPPAATADAVAPASATEAPAAPATTTDQQMEAIRQRIEQRRAQLRQQQAQPTPPPATPGKTQ